MAEEKEEQTLGLLRMTGLSPLSILLGKSTSRLCGALLLLAAQFPFTIFAVTLGGRVARADCGGLLHARGLHVSALQCGACSGRCSPAGRRARRCFA